MSQEKVIILQCPDNTRPEEIKNIAEILKKHPIEGYRFLIGKNFTAISKDEFKKLVGEMK